MHTLQQTSLVNLYLRLSPAAWTAFSWLSKQTLLMIFSGEDFSVENRLDDWVLMRFQQPVETGHDHLAATSIAHTDPALDVVDRPHRRDEVNAGTEDVNRRFYGC